MLQTLVILKQFKHVETTVEIRILHYEAQCLCIYLRIRKRVHIQGVRYSSFSSSTGYRYCHRSCSHHSAVEHSSSIDDILRDRSIVIITVIIRGYFNRSGRDSDGRDGSNNNKWTTPPAHRRRRCCCCGDDECLYRRRQCYDLKKNHYHQ